MSPISMIMPMAGRGSRFSASGALLPKPLLELQGRPFFWWATESLLRAAGTEVGLHFVVLREHVRTFDIEARILDLYPSAKVYIIPEVTAGAFATACVALPCLPDSAPVVINDCDHAFRSTNFSSLLTSMAQDELDGFLCHFESDSPSYSYASYDADGLLKETVEKQAISNMAIAGAYAFRSAMVLDRHAALYRAGSRYSELYVSGVYNTMVAEGARVRGLFLDRHVSFGTPAELPAAEASIGGVFP